MILNAEQFGKIAECVEKASASMEADIFAFFGEIQHPNDWAIQTALYRSNRKKNVLLWLTTPGGSADTAYRISRAIQRLYPDGKKILLVNLFCKSAGTLVALGADEIMMTDFAEIGPLDVQLSKPDEIGERTSGLTPIQALTSLKQEVVASFEAILFDLRSKAQMSTKLSAEIAAKLVTGLFSGIYNQLDPLRFGENQRALLIAEEYGKRLAATGGFNNLKPDTLSKLITGYPSHEFMIDREEAEKLFHVVKHPPMEVLHLVSSLSRYELSYYKDQNAEFIKFLSTDRNELAESLDYTLPEKTHEINPTDNGGCEEAKGGGGASPNQVDSPHSSGNPENSPKANSPISTSDHNEK